MAVMKECVNCTATQMQTMAKNQPVGYHFIYDLPHNIIRKYEVYMDSTCTPESATSSGRVSGQHKDGNGVDCTSFKAADEITPVNLGVQAIFNSLRATWLVNPTLANTAKAQVADFPTGSGGHVYDASKIAWDYPQGEFRSFQDYLEQQALTSRANANAFCEGLGDFIYGVSIAVNSVDVGAPPQVLTVHMTLDRQNATVKLKICNSSGDCVNFDVKVVNGQIAGLTYTGTFDAENMMLPSATGATPGQLNQWHWGFGPDADHFAQQIHDRTGVTVPSRPGCGSDFHSGLVVARVNGVVDSMTWQCIPN